jgi:hypothetical protein
MRIATVGSPNLPWPRGLPAFSLFPPRLDIVIVTPLLKIVHYSNTPAVRMSTHAEMTDIIDYPAHGFSPGGFKRGIGHIRLRNALIYSDEITFRAFWKTYAIEY